MATNYPGTGGYNPKREWASRGGGTTYRKTGVTMPQGPSGYNVGDRYYQNAYAQIAPIMERGIRDARAGLADQGILGSTGGQGRLSDIRQQYLAQASQMAEQNRQQDRTFTEAQRQANMSEARQAYELLAALALQRKELTPEEKVKYPTDPRSFSWLSKQMFAPVGDPPENERPMGDPQYQWARDDELAGKTQGQMDMERMERDSIRLDARLKAQEAWDQYMDKQALAMAKAEDDKDKPNPYEWLQSERLDVNALARNSTGKNVWNPSEIIDGFRTQFGIDVKADAMKGDAQAISAMTQLYPLITQKLKAQYGDEFWKHYDVIKGFPNPANAAARASTAAPAPAAGFGPLVRPWDFDAIGPQSPDAQALRKRMLESSNYLEQNRVAR